MTPDVAKVAIDVLANQDKDTVAAICLCFLEENGAGYPDVPLFQEQTRANAKFWADTAHQAELEAYMVASIDALAVSSLTHKQIKRLAAMAFNRMDDETKTAFKEWINKNDE